MVVSINPKSLSTGQRQEGSAGWRSEQKQEGVQMDKGSPGLMPWCSHLPTAMPPQGEGLSRSRAAPAHGQDHCSHLCLHDTGSMLVL